MVAAAWSASASRRAVFVDRDGTINRATVRDGKPFPPQRVEDFELLPGADSALRALRAAGFVVVVVTNQPDVASGVQARELVERMNDVLMENDLCDAVKVCYHGDRDGCDCRKPKPGMLVEAAREWQVDLARSFMVGDRWRDVAAGRAAGCHTLLVECGYHERSEPADAVVASLKEAADLILEWSHSVGAPFGG